MSRNSPNLKPQRIVTFENMSDPSQSEIAGEGPISFSQLESQMNPESLVQSVRSESPNKEQPSSYEASRERHKNVTKLQLEKLERIYQHAVDLNQILETNGNSSFLRDSFVDSPSTSPLRKSPKLKAGYER